MPPMRSNLKSAPSALCSKADSTLSRGLVSESVNELGSGVHGLGIRVYDLGFGKPQNFSCESKVLGCRARARSWVFFFSFFFADLFASRVLGSKGLGFKV